MSPNFRQIGAHVRLLRLGRVATSTSPFYKDLLPLVDVPWFIEVVEEIQVRDDIRHLPLGKDRGFYPQLPHLENHVPAVVPHGRHDLGQAAR